MPLFDVILLGKGAMAEVPTIAEEARAALERLGFKLLPAAMIPL